MKLTKTSANILLMAVTLLWGASFITIRMASDAGIGPGLMNALRGAIFTVLVLIFFHKQVFKMNKKSLSIGLIAGTLNALAFITQTIGNKYTTPSNNAFLTVTYVIMVPFIAWIFYKQKPSINVFIGIFICLIGTIILTRFGINGLNINFGDAITVLCALFFALSIAYIGQKANNTDFGVLAFGLGITHAVFGLLYWLCFEDITVTNINWGVAILPILFLGLFSSFICQTTQVVAQKYTSSSVAALIMSLEGLFGCIFSVMFGYEKLTWALIIGGTLIISSVILVEVKK